MKIIIVYYVFINPKRDWKRIIKGQVNDLLISGILSKSELHVHITNVYEPVLTEECISFISDLINDTYIEFRTNAENQFEYPGFNWLYSLAQENPGAAMLYLHTKGMVYHHSNERDMCEKTILRYTIDDFENVINIFSNNKIINKIGVYPSNEGWIWFNIFWIRSDYLINSNPPEYTPDNRYYYESYIGREAPKVNKGFSDCYSLVDKKVTGIDQSNLFNLIYDNQTYNYDMRRLPGGTEINIKFNKSSYSFFYGTDSVFTDVTELVYKKCLDNEVVFIPSDDIMRAGIFGDPAWGFHKYLFIKDSFGETTRYEPTSSIYIDLYQSKIYTVDDIPENVISQNFEGKLKCIHSKLKILHADFTSNEYPEQLISARYIKGPEKVLEIGANIGRNTLVISSLLNDSSNLVSLECDTASYQKLLENRQLNKFKFGAENAALSARPLIQKGWDTIPSQELPDGYTPVNTITLDSLKEKYPLEFDTLVLDCEGAFYYILLDYPEILNNINLIIMENDYHDFSHKEYIDNTLKERGFWCEYREAGGWGPCAEFFYEVWTRGGPFNGNFQVGKR
jgi:FkbM family methyltransferase